jgi:hypothetical protein
LVELSAVGMTVSTVSGQLLEHACRLELEGIVRKHIEQPSRDTVPEASQPRANFPFSNRLICNIKDVTEWLGDV